MSIRQHSALNGISIRHLAQHIVTTTCQYVVSSESAIQQSAEQGMMTVRLHAKQALMTVRHYTEKE